MPHFLVEYSSNLEDALDLPALFEKLHTVAGKSGVFPVAGMRSRGLPREQFRLADGHPDNGFVHVNFRIGAGRDPEILRREGEAIFAMLTEHVEALFKERPLALSFEISEIHPDYNFKKGNIRDYLKARAEKEPAA
jgi:5-carboxymethyl-2-hydroxymuconate isomerase